MKTIKGIELDLKCSEYSYEYNGFIFYFSSQVYRAKFEKLLESFIDIETIKLYNKYKIRCNFKMFLAFSLYKRIETRGFRIYSRLTEKEYNNFTEFQDYIA